MSLLKLRNEIKNLKQLQARFYNPIFKNYESVITDIKTKYNLLDDYDIAVILKNDLELKNYKCKTCGKAIHYSKHYKRFGEFCCGACVSKDVKTITKRKDTFIKKYGSYKYTEIPEIKNKIDNTNLKRYGAASYFSSTEYKVLKQAYTKELVLRCRKKGYDTLINLCKSQNLIKPLFTKEDYINYDEAKYDRILKWKCLVCNKEFESYYANGKLPICSCQKSKHKIQNEIQSYIETFFKNKIETDVRKIIPPLELDIYIPSLKLAIEVNGDYWHSSEYVNSNYHLNKTKLCEEKGIKLIHIFEHEWLNKRDLIKSRLRNAIDKKQQKIYARNCIVKIIDSKICANFLLDNHLQGSCSSNIKLGLYHKDELVAVMTFGKPRFNKNYEWELLRFCSSIPVIGGASKLLKYFEVNYKPKNIISYANRCWSSKLDNVYSKIGFKLIDESAPCYNYISKDGSLIISRYQAQKHKLKKLLGVNFNPKLTEQQNMLNAGFYQVYDCGNLVFIK